METRQKYDDLKNIDNEVMLTNCDYIVIFPIYNL